MMWPGVPDDVAGVGPESDAEGPLIHGDANSSPSINTLVGIAPRFHHPVPNMISSASMIPSSEQVRQGLVRSLSPCLINSRSSWKG